MKMKLLVIAALILPFTALPAEPLIQEPGLVTTGWLAERLDDPELRIIDARSGLGAYIQGHIPGAVYLNTETLRLSEGGVPARLLPPDQTAEILGKIGVANENAVVVYSSGEEAHAHATYVAYVLEYLGHRMVAVLDGGIEKWQQEERPISRVFPQVQQTSFTASINSDVLAGYEQVRSRIGEKQGVLLLDARSPKVFESGHIPGAENFFLQEMLDEQKQWKTVAELEKLADAAGATEDAKIITYCTSGRESSQIYFTLRHVLKRPNVASYHGSWIDWTVQTQNKENN